MNETKEINSKNFLSLISKKNIFFLSLILILFFIDRITKLQIIRHQLLNENYIYINDFLNFDLTWNTGIGFGLLSFESSLIYNLITFVICLIILIIAYFTLKSNNYEKILYIFILSGALGNLYDRIFYYAVPDFIDFHYKEFHWFTFNFADIFITIGILFLIIRELFFNNDAKKN